MDTKAVLMVGLKVKEVVDFKYVDAAFNGDFDLAFISSDDNNPEDDYDFEPSDDECDSDDDLEDVSYRERKDSVIGFIYAESDIDDGNEIAIETAEIYKLREKFTALIGQVPKIYLVPAYI